jgi:LuxR family maltose regulon positive regulatory protein
MQVRLFGELEAVAAGVPVPVRGAKQRALLALLALRPGQPVSADRLIDVLWGDGQAANPANALQAQIGQLRRTLGPAAILTTEAGYALDAGPEDVDVVRFEQLVAQGRRLAEAGQPADASAVLGEALGLRRGEALADFTYAGFFDAERARLDELTLVAIETRAGADLALGRHGELAAELEAWCRAHPLRERLWELLILALYRAGRQAEALAAYTDVRDRLAGELGIDPGPSLRELQARILAQDPSLSPEPVPPEPLPSEPLPPAPGSPGPAALLDTKFYVPRSRRDLVPRPRLAERLDRGSALKLVLVSAPAGFGKTTLLTEWLAAGPPAPADQRLVAWLSLDRADNDPASFWTYVIAALRTVTSEVGEGALALLQAPRPPPIETVLTALLNDLGATAGDIVLVLDDYHVIDASDVQGGMAFLLDHLPPWLHVVIASRTDPPLPLARWRARGDLAEIRAAELRFTPDEAAAYLNEMMGLRLTAQDVAALEGRTEGWIAALQLAALSMQGRDDVAGFIAGFAGDDRYVVDYLAEEVLERQPGPVQAFLLQTSILGRLSGPLCDAVTGQGGGKAMLAALDRGNLFLVPLDDRRQWYRYHRLFADVLQARLLDEQPGQVPGLHRRASAWYEQNGEPPMAIGHALAARDFGQAADLIERAIPAMRITRQEATVHGWLKALPDDAVRVRPMLSFAVAGALLTGGEPEEVEARLRDAEWWLEEAAATGEGSLAPPGEMVVADEEEYRRLPGAIELYRSALALVRGDVPGTVRHARRTLDLALTEDHGVRAGAAGFLGLAYWTSGDLEAAHAAWAQCAAGLRRSGQIADIFGCAIAMADIRLVQGRLGEAMRTYDQALQRASERDGPVLRGTADMYVGMSEVHRERGDLQAATQQLLRSQELGEYNGLPQNPYRWRVAMARIRQAEGDLGGALDLLNEAERLYTGDFFPNVRPVPALKARVWIAQGRLGEALGWAREQGLSADDDLSYLREFEHITLARMLLARSRGEPVRQVTRLLERLLLAAEAGGRTRHVIEILVLQALALQAPGPIPAALTCLERALTLAEPEGYVRVFVDAGPPIGSLLRAAEKQGTTRNYVRRLLAAVSQTGQDSPVRQAPVKQALTDPLSERELDVLRLLGTELDGPAIARELMVSLNTVRTHTKNIYTKLAVTNRRAAVRRAAELDLPRARNR